MNSFLDEKEDTPVLSKVQEPVIEEVPAVRTQGLKTVLKNNNIQSIDLLDEVSKGSLPSTSLLNLPRVQAEPVSPETIEYVSNAIENTLGEFSIEVKITNVESGPVITRYELVPPKGVRGEKISSLAKIGRAHV